MAQADLHLQLLLILTVSTGTTRDANAFVSQTARHLQANTGTTRIVSSEKPLKMASARKISNLILQVELANAKKESVPLGISLMSNLTFVTANA